MSPANRILAETPVESLEAYLAVRGGAALEAARGVQPDAVIAEIEAAGLRGRGGAGFPTGRKWRTISDARSSALATTVVVNGAEGEPGTFKDRTILRNNPYQVVEGALIAALVVGADEVVFAVKATNEPGNNRLRVAIDEICKAGWVGSTKLTVFEGPAEYLYGEETALLEALHGRPPFPRIAPPYRRGAFDLVEHDDDVTSRSGLSAHVEMVDDTGAPPALVDNVETMANVPGIVLNGAKWFRSVGTEQSPGTIVCTISGATVQAGVAEIPMGTTLRAAIDEIGGGVPEGQEIAAVMPGVSQALIPARLLDTPLTYEDMQRVGSGLGSAGFIVMTDDDDVVAVVAGASRFLAVESCGQCTPCKQDGKLLADALARIAANQGDAHDLELVRSAASTVSNEARCFLASQHEAVVGSLLAHFERDVAAHVAHEGNAVEPALVSEFTDVRDGRAHLDFNHLNKKPDWTYNDVDSGKAPAERLADRREHLSA